MAQLRRDPRLERWNSNNPIERAIMKFDPSVVQTTFDSPLGEMVVAATGRGLAGIWFTGQRHMPDISRWPRSQDHPVLAAALTQLREYFAGDRAEFELPLDLQGGTLFQQSVWRALLRIPRGSITSYGRLGLAIGHSAAVRAVGAAVGRNPLSVVIPCHRVVGSDGSLTGYAGGLERKRALLRLEGATPGRPLDA
jgi:methylated-DNA-[protein]-cysteine S-methyltransferase